MLCQQQGGGGGAAAVAVARGRQKCGVCMEFGATGARKVEFNERFTQKCDVSCMENGEPRCVFGSLVDSRDREDIRLEERRLVPTGMDSLVKFIRMIRIRFWAGFHQI